MPPSYTEWCIDKKHGLTD